MNNSLNSKSSIYLIYVTIAIIAAIIITYMTVWGPGLIDFDSFSYISVARSISEGKGLVYPISTDEYTQLTEFPPGYSFSLAFFSIFGLDALPAARWLNILLFSLTILLIGLTIYHATNNHIAAIITMLLLLLFNPTLIAYSFALSEGLFIFLTVVSFVLTVYSIERKSWLLLCLTGIFLSLLPLTRYIGLVNIFTSLVIIFAFSSKTLTKRLRNSVLVGIIGLIPIAIWIISLFFQSAQSRSRQFGYLPVDRDDLLRLFYTLTTWFLPESIVVGNEKEITIAVGIIFLITLLTLFYSRQKIRNLIWERNLSTLKIYLSLYLLYLSAYISSIIVVRLFFQPINLVDRLLLPASLSILILFGFFLGFVLHLDSRLAHVTVIAISSLLLVYYVSLSTTLIPKTHDQGLGLGRKSLHNSESIQLLETLSQQDFTIFSNYPWALYLKTGNIGIPINEFDPQVNSNFSDDVVIALFNFGNNNSGLLLRKYENIFIPIIEENIVAVYGIRDPTSQSK